MTQTERQNEILDLILREKCSNVKELSAAVYASPATIRRDLHTLENRGLVRLQYGNVIPLSEKPRELPLAFRQNQAKKSKQRIAQFAANMIPPNASVLLDASSSALYLADYLQPDFNITVFTNCLKTVIKLCEKNISVYCIGGKIDNKNFVTSGSWTEDNVNSIHVDYLFFSSKAIDDNGLISGDSESGIRMRRLMIEHSSKQYFLCDAEKKGRKSTFSLCNASEITGVITDGDFSEIPDINTIRAVP